MIRLILIAIVFGVLLYLINAVFPIFGNPNRCSHCNGEGYWKGIRGERNHCKTCDGTGVLDS